MGMQIRVVRYAREHAEKARKLLEELIAIRTKLNGKIVRVDDIYTSALTDGDRYVPISFMRADHEFNRYRVRMEAIQNDIIMNLTLSLSFCAEMVKLMVEDPSDENLNYKMRVRLVIDRVIEVATDEAMNRTSLAPLAAAISKIESVILLRGDMNLGLIRRRIMDFRIRIS
jgi:hypothetical protein